MVAIPPEITALALFIASAMAWTFSGIITDWRKNHGTEEWHGVDAQKLKDDFILGSILGIGAFVYTILTGAELPVIGTLAGFVLAIPGATGIIALVDKIIVNGIFNK